MGRKPTQRKNKYNTYLAESDFSVPEIEIDFMDFEIEDFPEYDFSEYDFELPELDLSELDKLCAEYDNLFFDEYDI